MLWVLREYMEFLACCASKSSGVILSVYILMGIDMSWQHLEFQCMQRTHSCLSRVCSSLALSVPNHRARVESKTNFFFFLKTCRFVISLWTGDPFLVMEKHWDRFSSKVLIMMLFVPEQLLSPACVLFCPSTLVMCLALNSCFSRVFLNALHPRIPRVQPPLDERLFSTQPGVAAVYSVSDMLLFYPYSYRYS